MSQGVIELNGKRYNAITGVLLGKSSSVPKHPVPHGKVIDGFVRPSHPATAAKPTVHTPKPVVTPHLVKKPDITRAKPITAPKPIRAHRPERAQTLMRRAVHKPDFKLKPAIKLQAPAEMAAKPQSALQHKHAAAAINPVRMDRAIQTNQHQAVRHFQPHIRPTPAATTHVPVIAVRPAPLPATAHPKHQTVKHDDIFERALAHATSHQQPMHRPVKRRTHRRLVNTLAIVGTFLVIGGFVGYLNLPTLQLRVASVQAGFGASMPGYAPTGYALDGGIQRSGGTVSLSFRSGDSRYTITQQASNWNSQTLLDNTLALSGAHQTIEKNGQTIYLYGEGANASWVNGGVRYDVNGNASLSKDEVAAIATSL